MTSRLQPVIFVRADRGRVVVERPGAAPWVFKPDRAMDAIEFARSVARLFSARLVIQLDREAAP